MPEVRIKAVGDYLEAARAVIAVAPDFEGIEQTQYLDESAEVAFKIPLEEVDAWIEMLETLADEKRDEDADQADKYELLAGYIEEEAEKFGRALSHNPVKTSFWRGI